MHFLSRFVLGALILVLVVSVPVHAKTPKEVLQPYKAYRAALEAGDATAAMNEAKTAWDAAETLLGDSKMTGDLAQNYADVAARVTPKDSIAAYTRAAELARFYPEAERAEIYINREIRAIQELTRQKKYGKTKKRLKAAEVFLTESNLMTSTFAGELMTSAATLYVKQGRNKTAEKYADRALAIFDASDDQVVTAMPLVAKLYSGYGKEESEDTLEAALLYQDVMENVDGVLAKDHPFRMRALGRWMQMRDKLRRDGKLETAEEAGLCQCWPYDKKRNETVKPIKRVPPKMPRKAMQSGFSLVEFDIDDAGKPINIRALESWPPYYTKPAMEAVEQWQYSALADGELASDRTDIVTTLKFILQDHYGNVID